MAGLLKPESAKMLVGAIRAEHFDLPIHVHTHDTAGTGVASMIAAARAGADVVDAATDALSGLTSQPSLGALVASTAGTELDTGISLQEASALNEYWEECRGLYAPFESGQKSGSAGKWKLKNIMHLSGLMTHLHSPFQRRIHPRDARWTIH